MNFTNLDLNNADSKKASLKYRLYLAMLKDTIDDFPKAVQAAILTNVLKPGAKHFYADFKINTINPTGSAGESQGTIGLVLSPQIEGISPKSLDWVYKLNGERVIAFWEICETKQRFIAGGPCSGGLLVSVQGLGLMEDGMMGALLNLTGDPCAEPFYFYNGPIILDDPEVIPADATTFALSDSKQFQLTSNAAATTLASITNITDADVGRIIELLGSGGTNPTRIDPTTSFKLQNGLSWTADYGSKISFQIFKTGTSTYEFLELDRS